MDTPVTGPRGRAPLFLLALGILLAATTALAQIPAGYTRAVDLAGAGRFSQAQALLDSLLAHDALPADLVDNGHYWRGECLYGQQAWLDALLAFERCLAEPDANKAEAAQLKIALCWTHLDQPERACREALRLLQRWPAGEHTGQARRVVQQACGRAGEVPVSSTGADPATPAVSGAGGGN